MKNKNIYVDIHVIQTVPPSNINRDDTGSPKTAQYGGATRARVSSQSWKKAIRTYFLQHGDHTNVGIRSLEIPRYVASKIMTIDDSIDAEKALEMAKKTLNKAGVKSNKENKTSALFFIGSRQAEDLAQAAIDEVSEKADLQKILSDNPAIDIALFGRMLADDPTLSEDASSQVSHAISTHAVQTEFDYYTGVDDFSSANNAGAGMLGTIEYNSSTLYRYANVAVHEFVNQIKSSEATISALKLFIEAFTKSMPTGKSNTFANQTLPQAVLLTVRPDRPVNLVSAFEKPVYSSKGYVDDSIKRLAEEFNEVSKWVEDSYFTLTINVENVGTELDNFKAFLETFEQQLTDILAET